MQSCIATVLTIAFFLSGFPKLQVANAGPVSSDIAAPEPCQMCCHSAAGEPGVPGIPGLIGPKGDLGPTGQKGDMGETGVIGEPGSPGIPGPKGNAGIGLPGKMGPRGPPGLSGLLGETGAKGQKGDLGAEGEVGPQGQKGDKGEIGVVGAPGSQGEPGPKGNMGRDHPGRVGARGPPGLPGPQGETGAKGRKGEPAETPEVLLIHRVAFTIRRRSSFSSSSDSTRLPFEETMTILPGTDIDLATGTFTCQVTGTYVFMFSVHKRESNSHVFVLLWRNNDIVVTPGSTRSDDRVQVAGGVVLVLQQGDSVYLTINGDVYGDLFHRNWFSGFLLYGE